MIIINKKETKVILGWILKLIGLTIAIYWFMSDGFNVTVGESMGLASNNSVGVSAIPIWLIVVLIVYLCFITMREYYNRNVNKPKSTNYKKYREMR